MSKNQIFSKDEQIAYLKGQLKEKEIIAIQLDNKLKRLTEQLEDIGCVINYSLSTTFAVRNILAERYHIIINKITNYLESSSNPTTEQYILNIISSNED